MYRTEKNRKQKNRSGSTWFLFGKAKGTLGCDVVTTQGKDIGHWNYQACSAKLLNLDVLKHHISTSDDFRLEMIIGLRNAPSS